MAPFHALIEMLPTRHQVKNHVCGLLTMIYKDLSGITWCDVMTFLGEALLGMILHWILWLPLLAYAIVFYCRFFCDTRKFKRMINWLCPYLSSSEHVWPRYAGFKVNIGFMSGRMLKIDANTLWTIRDLKNEVARLEDISFFQVRLFASCDEILDNMFLSSGSTEYVAVLRSVECGKWFQQLSEGAQSNLMDASDEVRSSKDCVLAAVSQNSWQSLKHAPDFHDDEDVATAAVRADGFSLIAVSARLRIKPRVALAAICRDRESLSCVPGPLRSDRDFLRRAYWVSSLDCKEDQRLRQEDLGTSETWEDVLFQHHGCLQRAFWKSLHKELRKRSLSGNMISTVMPLLCPVLVHAIANTSSFSWWHVAMLVWIPTWFSFFLLEPVFSSMHVNFVKWIAGPLDNLRRSSCRCSCGSCQ